MTVPIDHSGKNFGLLSGAELSCNHKVEMSQKSALTAPGGMTQGLVGMGDCREYCGITPSLCSPRLLCSGRSSV